MTEGTANVSLALTTSDPKVSATIKAEVERVLRSLPGVKAAVVDIAAAAVRTPAPPGGGTAGGDARAHQTRGRHSQRQGGRRQIHVRGQSGVRPGAGARGARPNGIRVGLMDCDIYGPSVPLMIGLEGRPEITGDGAGAMILPMEKHGVKVMSMGFLIDPDTPVIWRGPMITKTVQQFVQNVQWGDLEVLLIDLPPGTGDAQLTLAQTLHLDGAILVTTPQLAATNVARRGGLMFRKVNVPLLGVAENMSDFVDPEGRRHDLFGGGGGSRLAEELGTARFWARSRCFPRSGRVATPENPLWWTRPRAPRHRSFAGSRRVCLTA